MWLILVTNNLSIINNTIGAILKINNISRIILYAEPIFGGLNSLYIIRKAMYMKNNAVVIDIMVGFRIK